MKITIPELCLVVLIGPSGSGKSTFARRLFQPMEVLSSDFCRGLVSNDQNSQDATNDAFEVLRYIAAKRLARGLLTVIDATNVQSESRKPLLNLAFDHDVLPVAIVLNMPATLCHERNQQRPDRNFGPHVTRQQGQQLRSSLRGLEREGFRYNYVLNGPDEADQAVIERQPLWNNRKWDKGPFDIIGDIHGCYDELIELLQKLGYDTTEPNRIVSPPKRKVVFLGDLGDRGPSTPLVLQLVMGMVEVGNALCVPGNHDVKLLRKLRGKNVQITHGLAETLAQMESMPPEFFARVEKFIDSLVGHYVLDEGKVVVAHAGMKEQFIGRASRRVREFALYGETTGETDEFGLPVRYNWAAEYRGRAHVIYGHTPVPEADWLNRTINIDTGCVFGGKLTALRWPEKEIISVSAKRAYAQAARPFLAGQVPQFGQRIEGAEYTNRPGVYAIIRDDQGRIATVRSSGAIFLPGGGVHGDETPSMTLSRECREECGQDAVIGREIGRAVQHVTTRSGKHFAKQCVYFEATFLPGTECTPTESDHTLVWLEPAAAIEQFMLEADGWAVRQAPQPGSAASLSAQQQHDDVLDIDDVLGKRIVETRLHHSVTVREENAIAALEVMSRFAADPKWLIYLPPTMSPTETTDKPDLLEHPQEAFDYFRTNGVGKVVCEEKHMGSRAVVIVCRDESVVRKRFGIRNDGIGVIYTRTGRRFFDDRKMEAELLGLLHSAITRADFWKQFTSDWFCLDCELMPWSAKAQELLQKQYAAVGSSGRVALADAITVLQQANARHKNDGIDALEPLLQQHQERVSRIDRYVVAYQNYCWPVRSVQDLKLAPFHLLASEGHVHVDKDHVWHMQTMARLASAAPHSPLIATAHQVIGVADPSSVEQGIHWWEELTARGGEGMVIKPLEFVVRGKRGLVQPAVKCRGREYLRIIYGPEYDAPQHLERLRRRGVGAKRSLALREFALGIEALERFVRSEPLRRVHECAFAVLALESEPVDPRL